VLTLYEDGAINNSFLRFEKNHPFLDLAMTLFVLRFKDYVWGHQGPLLMDVSFYNYCLQFVKSAAACDTVHSHGGGGGAIQLLHTNLTSPIHFKKIFEFSHLNRSSIPWQTTRAVNNSLVFHWWDKQLKDKDKKRKQRMMHKVSFDTAGGELRDVFRRTRNESYLSEFTSQHCPLTRPFALT